MCLLSLHLVSNALWLNCRIDSYVFFMTFFMGYIIYLGQTLWNLVSLLDQLLYYRCLGWITIKILDLVDLLMLKNFSNVGKYLQSEVLELYALSKEKKASTKRKTCEYLRYGRQKLKNEPKKKFFSSHGLGLGFIDHATFEEPVQLWAAKAHRQVTQRRMRSPDKVSFYG